MNPLLSQLENHASHYAIQMQIWNPKEGSVCCSAWLYPTYIKRWPYSYVETSNIYRLDTGEPVHTGLGRNVTPPVWVSDPMLRAMAVENFEQEQILKETTFACK